MPPPPITFAPLTNTSHAPALETMMAALYTEDPPDHPIHPDAFRRTLHHLLHHPSAGTILLFLQSTTPVGYALLIPHWSNEFAGQLLFIDELFVLPTHRNRGIARAFFAHLHATRPNNALGLILEVSPTNTRAQKLYASLGFQPRKYLLQVCTWTP